MDDTASEPTGAPDARRGAGRTRARRPVSIVGVFGELLITLGVVTLLYVTWQLWIGDVIYAAQHNAEATELSEAWQREYEEQFIAVPTPTDTPAPDAPAEPPAMAQPKDAQVFATMRIPRFGDDYAVKMAGGVSRARTLDPIGIGHYTGTEMPGDVGNFAVAAHRTTWGKPFNRIADLRLDDAIVVETKDGWYVYRFRTLEYVRPDAVDVLLDVPQQQDAVNAGSRYITMTSCSPMFAMTERIVAYGVFESFTPRSAGAPAAVTEAVSS